MTQQIAPRDTAAHDPASGSDVRPNRPADSFGAVEACVPALRRYAWALLRNKDDADDLVHDCIVRALSKIETKRDGAEMRAWLFTIMHNLFISRHRQRRARAPTETLQDHHEAANPVLPGQEHRLHWRDLLRGLASLPEEQRSVVLLVSVEDLSYAETAAVLGIPVGTVMSRLARGREKLRQLTGTISKPALRRVT